MKVCIDAGHGGSDVGALGPSGLRESEMALDVCKRIERLLKPYVEVVMTRSSDVFLSLSDRAKICNDSKCSLFVSYHFNSASALANGWEIFTTRRDNNSDKLATCIGEAHALQFPNQYARCDWSDGDIDKEANFAVIRKANCPAVLMEGEFIHTMLGEGLISNDKNREKMAKAVFEGVTSFLDIKTTQVDELTNEERLLRLEQHLGLV